MVKEKLAAIGKPLRKFASTPNLAAAVIYMYFLIFDSVFLFIKHTTVTVVAIFLFVSSLFS